MRLLERFSEAGGDLLGMEGHIAASRTATEGGNLGSVRL